MNSSTFVTFKQLVQMKSLLIIFCIGLISFSFNRVNAQSTPIETPQKAGKVTYFGDPRIETLVETKRKINKKNEGIKGFRIQLYSGDRKAANELKGKFLDENESLEAYIVYEQPYFKTRVGDFRTKIEAEKALQSLHKQYPGCFVLSDFIIPQKLEELTSPK